MSWESEKAAEIAKVILQRSVPADEQFQTACILINAGFCVTTFLVSNKRIGTLRTADLLFDLRRTIQELEKEFKQQ